MDIGKIPIIPPVPSVDTNVTGRGAQATVLPQFQTVQRAARSDSAALSFREVAIQKLEKTQQADKPKESNSLADEIRKREIRREIEYSRESAALIFKSIDLSTGEVVQQYPEEARLNLREYLSSKEEAQQKI